MLLNGLRPRRTADGAMGNPFPSHWACEHGNVPASAVLPRVDERLVATLARHQPLVIVGEAAEARHPALKIHLPVPVWFPTLDECIREA